MLAATTFRKRFNVKLVLVDQDTNESATKRIHLKKSCTTLPLKVVLTGRVDCGGLNSNVNWVYDSFITEDTRSAK